MCKTMMQSLLFVGDDDPRRSWEYRSIFQICRYDGKTGTITVQLGEGVTDLFLRLRRDFTRIPIAALLTMKSKYAIRLFEVMCEKMRNCMPFADHATEMQLSIEEIRTATGTDQQKTYDIITNLKRRILGPALEEIEQAASWKIICEDVKRSRRVVGFRLVVWSRNGWEYLEECKRKGIIPERLEDQRKHPEDPFDLPE
jgi:plasmid replication initiation protein